MKSLMATCDRCGKSYEIDRTWSFDKKPNGIMLLMTNIHNDAEDMGTKDLCPECMEELNRWLKPNPKGGKNEN